VEIYQSTELGGFEKVYETTSSSQTSHAFTGLSEMTVYRYKVRALNSGGASPFSAIAGETTPGTVPGAVTDLTAACLGETIVRLHWTDASSETGYRVRVNDLSLPVIMLAANTTSYDVICLKGGTDYDLTVVPINRAGSGTSATASITTLLGGPGQLAAASVKGGGINLFWADNSNFETGYVIKAIASASETVPPDGPNWQVVGGSPTDSDGQSAVYIGGLAANTTYWLRVYATGADCDSASGYLRYRTGPASGSASVTLLGDATRSGQTINLNPSMSDQGPGVNGVSILLPPQASYWFGLWS